MFDFSFAAAFSLYCNSLASSRCSVTGLIQRRDFIQMILADASQNVRLRQLYSFAPSKPFTVIYVLSRLQLMPFVCVCLLGGGRGGSRQYASCMSHIMLSTQGATNK